MAAPLLTLQGIALTFGGTPLLTAADLIVAPGDRIALVGRNGSGKSTLLKIAAGYTSGFWRALCPSWRRRSIPCARDEFQRLPDHATVR